MSSPPDFLPSVDPKERPDRPEPMDYDFEEQEEYCFCGFELVHHTAKQLLNCAIKECQIIRGVKK